MGNDERTSEYSNDPKLGSWQLVQYSGDLKSKLVRYSNGVNYI